MRLWLALRLARGLARGRARGLAVVSLLPLAACGIGAAVLGGGPDTRLGQSNAAPSVFGYAVADEPQAALVGQQILSQGGNAADAAAAMGFALGVTLPSRAGLGGGGACVMRLADSQQRPLPAVALSFPPGMPAGRGGTRPAAVPEMARGLLAMQARFGLLNFASVVVPAERLAGGVAVSPALEQDLSVVGPALLADPAAAGVFGAGGQVLVAGANMSQPDLAATLESLRTQGVQGFYQGDQAEQFVTAIGAAGGAVTKADLAATAPVFTAPKLADASGDEIAFVPAAAPAGTLPASAGFAALDKNGGVVACVVTMNNLFGTGRVAPGTGILLAASPAAGPTPLLAAAIAYRQQGGAFRAAVTGTGQDGAAAAAADGMFDALNKTPFALVPEPGRANVIACPGGVPGGEASCAAQADPRGHGLAIGGR